MTLMTNENDCQAGCNPRSTETVESVFNHQIEEARKNVERLCIAKARAEALNLHKYPYHELVDTLRIW